MEYLKKIIKKKKLKERKIRAILDESLIDKDIYCKNGLLLLKNMGLSDNEALALLAHHKSNKKYGYEFSSATLHYLLDLAEHQPDESPLRNLIKSPFFLVKACWIIEHAPFFLYYDNLDNSNAKELDQLILGFAGEYEDFLSANHISFDSWEQIHRPRRVKAVTFWENQTFDPVVLLEKALNDNIEGLELSVDFHPFNYFKLLPEEISEEKRFRIREACRKSGLKIDIHSPIVGPYYPSPDPKKGSQLFFNPAECFDLMCETLELAKDIGAGSIVIHHIDSRGLGKMAELILKANGSRTRVTIENYCQTDSIQNSSSFLLYLEKIIKMLPNEVKINNFGVTLDVGHLNIEGEDPLVAAEKIGRWCLENKVFLRLHATDNYGKLLFSPPAYSADVHGNVTGRGINNNIIIKLLRSMGHEFDVVAEQIKPLTKEDMLIIHEAQTFEFEDDYNNILAKGKELISGADLENLFPLDIIHEKAHSFLAGLEGINAFKEYMVYRKIQDQKYLSVDEAKKISRDFMKMPQKFRSDLIDYVDDLLLPIQSESGLLQKNEIDLICNNICGALFGTINNEHLNKIFSKTRIYKKGDIICEQGTVGQEIYFIKEGSVIVYINSAPLASLSPGEIFGEISLFYNVKRTATIKAASDNTKLGFLTRGSFEALLKNSFPYSHDLVYRLYNILPERLRNLNDKYKTAINALDLIFEGSRKKFPGLEQMSLDLKPKKGLFPTLTSEEAGHVFQDERNYDADELIFAEGDKADGAYLIIEGKAKAVTFSQNYEEIILGELVKGDIFGEMALIDDKPRSAGIIAVNPCRITFVKKTTFNEFIETRSEMAFRFMSFICLSLFKRILTLDKMYADIKKEFV